jgi:hypothetical protein
MQCLVSAAHMVYATVSDVYCRIVAADRSCCLPAMLSTVYTLFAAHAPSFLYLLAMFCMHETIIIIQP